MVFFFPSECHLCNSQIILLSLTTCAVLTETVQRKMENAWESSPLKRTGWDSVFTQKHKEREKVTCTLPNPPRSTGPAKTKGHRAGVSPIETRRGHFEMLMVWLQTGRIHTCMNSKHFLGGQSLATKWQALWNMSCVKYHIYGTDNMRCHLSAMQVRYLLLGYYVWIITYRLKLSCFLYCLKESAPIPSSSLKENSYIYPGKNSKAFMKEKKRKKERFSPPVCHSAEGETDIDMLTEYAV